MSTDFLPRRDGDLSLFTANFNTKITAAPTTYGLTSGQATAYATVNTAWQAALITATTPATRTKVTVAAKDVAKADVEVLTRQYALIVQGYPPITPSLLETLGLTVRKTTRSPVPAPTTAPIIGILSAMGQQLTLSVNDTLTPNSRKLPTGVIAAEVYFSFGTTPPTNLNSTVYQGQYSKYPGRFAVDGSHVGQTCYILTRWRNRIGDVGPLSAVASAVVSN